MRAEDVLTKALELVVPDAEEIRRAKKAEEEIKNKLDKIDDE